MNKKLIIILIVAAGILVAAYAAYDKFYSGSSKVPAVTVVRTGGQDPGGKDVGYQLLVDGKPYFVRGVCYNPIPIGKDYEYNFWGDMGKPWLQDGKLMKEMGVNTVRFYRPGKNPVEVRQVLDDLYKKYKIRTLMGHYLGFWDWPPPNYSDAGFNEKIRGQVLEMVSLYKNHPGVLAWIVGNENNYSFDRNIQRWTNDELDAMDPEAQRREKAKIYYSFINSLAKEIKKIDPKRPVIMGVGEVSSLEFAKEQCPDVDIIGMISYRGPGFGNLFRQVKQKFDIPVIMIEWGADSYNAFTRDPDEEAQAEFLKLQWQDIERNADPKKGAGNSLGGTAFEWNDEWWKGNENLPHTWSVQDTGSNWFSASYHFDAQSATKMNMNEEWWGVVGLSPQKSESGNNERITKKSYSVLKSLWAK